MHQYAPFPDRDVEGFRIRCGASDVVEYIEQEFVWKHVNHRRMFCAAVALACPTGLEVSVRPPQKLKGALWTEIFTRFVRWFGGILFESESGIWEAEIHVGAQRDGRGEPLGTV